MGNPTISTILRKSFNKVVTIEQKFDSYNIKFKPDGTFYGLNDPAEIAKGKPARLTEKELFELYAKGKKKGLKKQTLFAYESTALGVNIEGYKLACQRYVGERSEEIALLACLNKRIDILAKAGQGKTTAAAQLIVELDASDIVFFTPTIGLAQQTAKALKSNPILKGFDILEVHSQSGATDRKVNAGESKIVVATYDQIKHLLNEPFDLLIIDEIHQLISEADYRHKAVNSLLVYRAAHHARNANAISIGLTATPNPLNYAGFCSIELKIAASEIYKALNLGCDKEEFAANLQLDTTPVLIEAEETQKLNIKIVSLDRTRTKVGTKGKSAASQSQTLQQAIANAKEQGKDAKAVHLIELNDSTTNKALVSYCNALEIWSEEINSAEKHQSEGYKQLIGSESLAPKCEGNTIYFTTKLLECGINCKSQIASIHTVNPPSPANALQFFARPRMQADGTNKELNCFIYRAAKRDSEIEKKKLVNAKAELKKQLQQAISECATDKAENKEVEARTQNDNRKLANKYGPKLAYILFSISQRFYTAMSDRELADDLKRLNSSAEVEIVSHSKTKFAAEILDSAKQAAKEGKQATQKELAQLCIDNAQAVIAAINATTQTHDIKTLELFADATEIVLTDTAKQQLIEQYGPLFGPDTKTMRSDLLKRAKTIAAFASTYPDADPKAYLETLVKKLGEYHLEENKDAKKALKLGLNYYEQKFAFDRRKWEIDDLRKAEQIEHKAQVKLFKAIKNKQKNANAGKCKQPTKGWVEAKAKELGLLRFGFPKIEVLAACNGYSIDIKSGKRTTKNSTIKLIAKEFKHEYL